MRQTLSFLSILLVSIRVSAQISNGGSTTISPDPTSPICPKITTGYTLDNLDPTVLSYDGNKSKAVAGFTSSVNGGKLAFSVSFNDVAGVHTVVFHNSATTEDMTITFNVSTLAGVTPAFSAPPPVTPPAGYADIVTIPLCNVNPFNYTGPLVFYGGNSNNGTAMTTYEWVAPKGWLVNGQLSNGSTPVSGSPTISLTPDPINGGDLQFWALNNCNPALATSNKIRIKLDRPAIGLSVNNSPTATVTCGNTSPLTFTVDNVSTAGCITGYQWNAGTGWLDAGGTPVSSPFTTTTNTVTLYPQPYTAPSDVSVTLMINGNLVASDKYTETITYKLPESIPSTISGPTDFCGTTPVTYTVDGLPAGSSPSTFTVTQDDITGGPLTVSSSGNTLTISNPNGAYGFFKIDASTLTPCGQSTATQRTSLYAGIQPPNVGGSFIQGETIAANSTYSFPMITHPHVGDATIGWNWIVSPHSTISGQNTQTVTFTSLHLNTGQTATVVMQLRYETTCGWSDYTTASFIISGNGGGGRPPINIGLASGSSTNEIVLTYEIPAEAVFSPDISSQSSKAAIPITKDQYVLSSALVYNTVGQLKKKIVFAGHNTMERVGVSDLPNGIYFIEILTPQGRVTKKFLVQH